MAEFYKGPIFVTNPIFSKPKKAWGEESAPGDCCKKSFYPYFRKFAYLCRCLGCFPVTITKSSSKLSFTWKSAPTICSILVLPTVQLVFLTFYPISDPVIQLFIYLFLLFPTFIKTVFIWKIPALVKLVRAMDSLDTDPCLKESEPEKTRKDCKFVIIFSLITILLTTFPYMFLILGVDPKTFGWYWLKFQYIFFLVSQMSLYYVVSYQMNRFYDRFSTSLEALSETPCKDVKEEQIESYRLTHACLVSCVRLMDNTFGTWIGYVYIITSCWFVIELYQSIYGSYKLAHALTLLEVIFTLFYIYYPAVLSDYIFSKNKDTIHFILKMALEPFPDNELFQVMYFLRQIKVNVAAVSAVGLANVNKAIITKALSLFATFFVATIQMESQVVRFVNVLRQTLEVVEEGFTNTTLSYDSNITQEKQLGGARNNTVF